MSHDDSDWRFAFNGDSPVTPKPLTEEKNVLIAQMQAAATSLEATREPQFIEEVVRLTRVLEGRGYSIDAIAEHTGMRPDSLRYLQTWEGHGD